MSAIATTSKRGKGRPPGKHGPYLEDAEKRDRYMIRLPAWLIEVIRDLAIKNKTSAGKMIEKAIIHTYEIDTAKFV
jgi:hypothetical protein